jgi:shikimate kinase
VTGSERAEPNVVLVGFTAAGKTTVGALLAARLGWPHLDLDAALEARIGLIPAYCARHGVPAFRAAERAVLAAALPPGGAVVSAGAGTVLPRATRRLLCDGARVFLLDVPPAVVLARLAALPPAARHRPDLLGGDALARVARELEARRPLYASLGAVVDATLPAAEVAAVIAARLAG